MVRVSRVGERMSQADHFADARTLGVRGLGHLLGGDFLSLFDAEGGM